MRKLTVSFIFHCWMTSALTNSCDNPKYISASEKPVEVYQVKYFLEINSTPQGAADKAELLGNSVTLPSGTVCKYELSGCYDPKNGETYTWKTSKGVPQVEVVCDNITYIGENGNNYTYEILTLRADPLVQFLVAKGEVSMFFVQLTTEEIFCGKQVWRTDQRDLVVAVGKENFIDAVYEDISKISLANVSIYDLEEKEDAYSSMMIKCEVFSKINTQNEHFEEELAHLISNVDKTQKKLGQYTNEISLLKAAVRSIQNELRSKNSELDQLKKDLNEVYGMKTTVRKLQNELNKYKYGNTELRENLDSLRDDLQQFELKRFEGAGDIEEADVDRTEEETNGDFPQTFANMLAGFEDCPDCVLFPYENVFSVVIALFYVSFSVINTIMNYFSLRMLRSERQRSFVFYTLTQGLTTRYICNNQHLVKRKVDKWLLDIVE